jgi:hypothetical protein
MTPYVAGVVKRLTRRIVAPLCVGSSPTTRPIFFYLKTGIPGEIGTGSLIWGYRQAVRQRTLTPLSVVRLHLPLPVIKSCRQPSAGFFAWPEGPPPAYLVLLIAYRYPLSASQSFCIGRAIKGRSFYVQIKDQLRPTWRSYAGHPQQRRISVQAVREALIKSLLDFILVFLFNARNQLTRIASCLRRLMTQHWIKIHMKSDSANESVLPYASLADKSQSALFYNVPVRAPPKPSEPSGRQAGPS